MRTPRTNSMMGLTDQSLLDATGNHKRMVFRGIMLARAGGLCGLCFEPVSLEDMHLDHIDQKVLGGPNDYQNLRPTHAICNLKRERRHRGYTTPDGDVLVPAFEAARRVNVDASWVRRWCAEGILLQHRAWGYGQFLVRLGDVERLAKQHYQSSLWPAKRR